MRPAWVTGEIRTYLPNAIAERDDVVEAAPGEDAELLRRSAADVDSPLGHDAYCIGMNRLRVAASARCFHLAARDVAEQGFGDL
jgi:hypothetical protein